MLPRLYARKVALFFLCAIFCVNGFCDDHTPIPIHYPGVSEGQDFRIAYYVELLTKALAKSGKPYQTSLNGRGLPHPRQIRMMEEGTLDVVWDLSTEERESSLLPVRIPIDKGLIGWRIFIINPDDQPLFSSITQLDELKSISAGQVYDWQDLKILRANGLSTVTAPNYPSTFKMLERKHFRYFPRAITEIWEEIKNHKEYNLAVEKSLLIRYPTAYYFYVSKNNPQLAQDIENGLKLLISSGEFDGIFNRYYRDGIEKADLLHRRIFDLENPLNTPDLPTNKDYWFDIARDLPKLSKK